MPRTATKPRSAPPTPRTRPSTSSRIDRLEKRVELLEAALEDRVDVEESRRVLDDPETEWVDWRDAKRRLGGR
jgi:hypothetical protein